MIAFYTDKHLLHAPERDVEVVQRGELILAALEAAALGPIAPPDDFGMGPITAVHTPGLLHLLQTAYERVQAVSGTAPTSTVLSTSSTQSTLSKAKVLSASVAAPDCFAIRSLTGHVPHNIWGQLGYYCTDSTTPILDNTWEAAYWAAQLALTAASHVQQHNGAAYALCRPPGHHAYADMYGGYCFLNNAAIAAHWLTQSGAKVAIVDVDYHHGNGTQAIFYDRDDVFFCSIHADPDEEYPYYCGFAHEKGAGAGYGRTFNLPLPLGTADTAYLETLDRALIRTAQFDPDFLIISLGADTALGDPIGRFRLTEAAFRKMGQQFKKLNKPMLILQEGGYRLDTLGQNVLAFLLGVA
jgi:acetoin utilization deacetylase AcuC-like enzyme